jgi:hypothetical protein
MRSLKIFSLMIVLLSGVGIAQQDASPIPSPEALAGRWEASDGHGGAVGMNIVLTTFIHGTPETLARQPQFEGEFAVGLYQRMVPDVEPLGFNFFTAPNGGANWDGHRLGIHLTGKADLPTTDVDLVWHPESQTWSGLFERGRFRKQIVLKRPASETSKSPFVGTWFEKGGGMMNNCVHIAQQQDGALAAWSDDIMIPRRVRYANGIQPPTQTQEHYGEIAKAKMDAPDQITVELRAYTAMCCSHPFTAKIAENGRMLSGVWPSGPNQAQRVAEWEKMQGNSCLAKSDFKTP